MKKIVDEECDRLYIRRPGADEFWRHLEQLIVGLLGLPTEESASIS